MSKPKSFKENLVAWRSMVENLAPKLDEMPRLRDPHAALVALLERAEALQAEQAVYASKLRQVNQERAVAGREGRKLRNQIALGLQVEMGAESERLIEFGVPPQARHVRRKRSTQAERAARAAEAANTETTAAPADAAQPGDEPALN